MNMVLLGPGSAFLDSFVDDDGVSLVAHKPNIGGPWANFGASTAKILSNTLVPNTGTPDGTMGQYNDATLVNYTLTCNWTNTIAINWPALCVRLNPANGSGYWLLNQGNTNNIALFESNGVGGFSSVATATATGISGTAPVSVVLTGSKIEVYIRSILKLTYTNATRNPLETHFGVSMWATASNNSVVFDDFRIVP